MQIFTNHQQCTQSTGEYRKNLQNSSVSLWSWRHFACLLEAWGKISVTISQPFPRRTICVCSHMCALSQENTQLGPGLTRSITTLHFSKSPQSFKRTVPSYWLQSLLLIHKASLVLCVPISQHCWILCSYDWLVIDITNKWVDIGLLNEATCLLKKPLLPFSSIVKSFLSTFKKYF